MKQLPKIPRNLCHSNGMTFAPMNYILMLVGAVIIVIGFLLMSGGTKATPEEFSYDIFSWRRITLAPIVIVVGFAFEIFAIMKRFDKTTTTKSEDSEPAKTAAPVKEAVKEAYCIHCGTKVAETCTICPKCGCIPNKKR